MNKPAVEAVSVPLDKKLIAAIKILIEEVLEAKEVVTSNNIDDALGDIIDEDRVREIADEAIDDRSFIDRDDITQEVTDLLEDAKISI